MANFHIKFVNRNILLRYFKFVEINAFVTGPPTHSVGGQYCFARWRLSTSVIVCCRL